MNDAITSTIRYAKADNEALVNEKAYILNYPTSPEIPKSNFDIGFFPDIQIQNLRTANLSYSENGIALTTLPRCMPKEDFDDEKKVEEVYLPEVHGCIRETLGVDEIYIFDYMIRKREPAFPFQSKTKDSAPQPALSAHIGKPTCLNFISPMLFISSMLFISPMLCISPMLFISSMLTGRSRLHNGRNQRSIAEILQRTGRRIWKATVPDSQVGSFVLRCASLLITFPVYGSRLQAR